MTPFSHIPAGSKESQPIKINTPTGEPVSLTLDVKALVIKHDTICIVRPVAEVVHLKDGVKTTDQVTVIGRTNTEMQYGKGVIFDRSQTPVSLAYQKSPNSEEEPIGTVDWVRR